VRRRAEALAAARSRDRLLDLSQIVAAVSAVSCVDQARSNAPATA
jgi:hypothetical protein